MSLQQTKIPYQILALNSDSLLARLWMQNSVKSKHIREISYETLLYFISWDAHKMWRNVKYISQLMKNCMPFILKNLQNILWHSFTLKTFNRGDLFSIPRAINSSNFSLLLVNLLKVHSSQFYFGICFFWSQTQLSINSYLLLVFIFLSVIFFIGWTVYSYLVHSFWCSKF